MEVLEQQADQAEQYSRRNCLRISGYKEQQNEDTDEIVMKLASDIGCNLQLTDIDRSHRIGRPAGRGDRPRDIIVKFSTYRNRQKLYKQRTALKVNGHPGVFVNEDLTKLRSGLLYNARKLLKAKLIKGAWSSDGIILVKDKNDSVSRICSASDLVKFESSDPGPATVMKDQPLATVRGSYSRIAQRR